MIPDTQQTDEGKIRIIEVKDQVMEAPEYITVSKCLMRNGRRAWRANEKGFVCAFFFFLTSNSQYTERDRYKEDAKWEEKGITNGQGSWAHKERRDQEHKWKV